MFIKNGVVDTTFSLPFSGEIQIKADEISFSDEIHSLPGWLSIIPPIIAILLALLFRQIILALFAGIYIGAVFIYDFNFLTAFLRTTDTIIVNNLYDTSHLSIILFTLMIGGVVGIISGNGGTRGLADVIIRYAKTVRSGLLSSWLLGLVIFFDDYANTLIVGNMMRPITDKLKISREKLAYIVDSTAAPVASLVIISTWIGYEIGLIQDGLKIINSSENAYDVFIQTIPYRFYPIAALIFVFLTSFMKRDFGPMYHVELKARNNSYNYSDIADNTKDTLPRSGNWFNAAIPILILLVSTILGLIYTGISSLEKAGINDYSIQKIISSSDSYLSLIWGSFISTIVAIIMTLVQRINSLQDTFDHWLSGVKSMLLAIIILTGAWSLSWVTSEIKTADYLVSILSDTLNPRFLPVLVFIISAIISFSTGTSWGTMAIVMPIIIPLSFNISQSFGLDAENSTIILHGVISSVLTGSVFGDHCSPISDTTILSAMASGSGLVDHVNTQLPYAILVGVLCMIIGDIPTAFGFSPYLSIILIIISLIIFLRFWGKKVPDPKI